MTKGVVLLFFTAQRVRVKTNNWEYIAAFFAVGRFDCMDSLVYTIHGLLHDAHEAIIGDVVKPTAKAIDCLYPGSFHALNSLKNKAYRAIYKALGIPLSNDEAKKMIAEADELALAVESRLFLSEPDIEWRPEIGVHDDIAGMVENLAYKVFELS